jgi:hypothetical protein
VSIAAKAYSEGMQNLLKMTFASEPATPVRNLLLNTEQAITKGWANEIRTPAQGVEYFNQLIGWCNAQITALGTGNTQAGAGGASHG